ncbi:hypothetical protein LOTGIDRAFT_225030 [Lottia gigantea]|uniref:AH domain-containing protein n=1 Tax=Lottia gigantea TaxID=225164 RepID=V4AD56_LOTGI|nr:hypothetical protein LOTGIDRAFT_225030 [Lottia gigantea]ESP01919.1 hypothetical protein LOTGIDRAFT_225030 [Lottia gigantea]
MNRGYSGSNYDRHVENTNTSTLHRMKETYWTTKQAVIKKLGKKEDEHVVASDSQLDAKLEVFKAIQRSSMELLRVIERYQDRLCAISMEENAMGRFLKSHSNSDKTRAGKMMAAVGKSQSFSAQQRLALRVPLVRLYQEVETFRYRAISDTLLTINKMEGARTEYRGALLWMKKVSEELDPDMYKQLEKFRKVQTQVRKTKAKFDKLKLDVMQKVDLLAASRCNMFSHVLANYQTTLLHFWEKTSRTMSAVAESFKGYQYYEFNLLKELAEPCRELSEKTSQRQPAEKDTDNTGDETQNRSNNKKIFKANFGRTVSGAPSMRGLRQRCLKELLHFEFSPFSQSAPTEDLDMEEDNDKDDMTLLNEIMNAPSTGGDEFTQEWQAVFGINQVSTPTSSLVPAETDQSKEFMPSSLLDMSSLMGLQQPVGGSSHTGLSTPTSQPQQTTKSKSQTQQPSKKNPKSDMSAWFNLFADLDPLSNPDAIGRKQNDMAEM